MEASQTPIEETQPASAKLQAGDAAALLGAAERLIAMKGRKVQRFDLRALPAAAREEAVAAMLGPTGNLRAPTIRSGATLLVGYNEEVFTEVFGGG